MLTPHPGGLWSQQVSPNQGRRERGHFRTHQREICGLGSIMQLQAANAFLSTYMSLGSKHLLLLQARLRILFPRSQASSRSCQDAVKTGAAQATANKEHTTASPQVPRLRAQNTPAQQTWPETQPGATSGEKERPVRAPKGRGVARAANGTGQPREQPLLAP